MTTPVSKIKATVKKTTPKTLAMTTLAGLLAACNSDSETAAVVAPVAPIVPATTNLTGAVIKGPAQNMIVGVDTDGDGAVDGPTTLTSGTGTYSITSSNPNATIIAVSGPNTIDTSSGQPLLGVTLKAPPLTQEERDSGMQVAVTPVSTIMEASPDIEPAQLAIAMGIPSVAADGTPIDIRTFNPYAADADPAAALAAEKAAQQVMVTIQAVSAAAEGAGMSVEDAFEQAMASVAEVVSIEAEKIDVSSTEAIAAAEATMATNKVDFSNTETLAAVTTAVKTKVTAAAIVDTSIIVDEVAFAATLETAVTAVANVVSAIEKITDTDLTSQDSMATFATLTDLATEIKAAAVAEVEVPGSGAVLVTLIDEAAVTAAVEVAKVEVAAYVEEVAAADSEVVVVVEPVVVAPVVVAPVVVAPVVVAPAPAPFVPDTTEYLVVKTLAGATWNGGTVAAGTQNLDMTYDNGVLDVTSDIQVEADDFTGAFSASSAAVTDLGILFISNITTPVFGSATNAEITVVITETSSGYSPTITAGFELDWKIDSTGVYTLSSDDSALDVTYKQSNNSSVTLSLLNQDITQNTFTITNDGLFGGGPNTATLNLDVLGLIEALQKTGDYTFANLESRFAVAGDTLEVDVDVSNLKIAAMDPDMATDIINTVTNITATLDIV